MTGKSSGNSGTMHLGVDFGISMTVIAVAGPDPVCHTLEFPGISREYPESPGSTPVHGIPSLVEFLDGNMVRCGDGAARGGAAGDPGTARWLRHYLCSASTVKIPAGNGHLAGYGEAAADLLVPVLSQALRNHPGSGLVFTLPAEVPAAYPEFLREIARTAGAASCAFIGDYEAAVQGYRYSPVDGEPFLVVTFDETGMVVTVLAAEDRSAGPDHHGLRVLASATGSVGCQALDGWVLQDLLAKFRLPAGDPRAVRLAPVVRYQAARLRENLPVADEQEIRITDSLSGKIFSAAYTKSDFDRVLADHEVIPALQECTGRALSALRMRGWDVRRVRAVLLLGPGCTLTAVKDAVQSRFPEAVIYADHPIAAVARGAAEYAPPAPDQDRIAHSYALRYWDPAVREHHYRFIVHSGTRYPSAGQVARIIISAAYDGQTLLGIPLYEIAGTAGGAALRIELVSDNGGGMRLAVPAQDAETPGQVMHINENSPTLLAATPPARKGEPRFECTFTIDAGRNLCLSARDLLTGALVKLNAPVHRLT
jgi:molecular chaperone DnaK